MATDLTAWPSALPYSQLKTHSLAPQSRVIASKMDSGFQRLRQRRINPPTDMPVSWLMSSDQFSLFMGWFEHVISHGTREFTYPVKVGDTTHQLPCKFKPSQAPYRATDQGGGNWRVTANFSVRNVPVIPLDVYNAINDIGFSVTGLDDYFESVGKTANGDINGNSNS